MKKISIKHIVYEWTKQLVWNPKKKKYIQIIIQKVLGNENKKFKCSWQWFVGLVWPLQNNWKRYCKKTKQSWLNNLICDMICWHLPNKCKLITTMNYANVKQYYLTLAYLVMSHFD